jgi:hypothetical protein
VVLLILIPLLSPNSSKGGVGFQAIAEAMGMAAVKAVAAITAIIAGGRLVSCLFIHFILRVYLMRNLHKLFVDSQLNAHHMHVCVISAACLTF